MKKLVITMVAMLAVVSSALAANPVRISQVYGGGGASTGTPTYKNDYVELFNAGATTVDLSNWTIEYGSATGNWGSSAGNYFTFPAGAAIEPCGYVLVSLGTTGGAGADLPITPDYSNSTTNLSATSGKVGLFNAVNANLACGSEIAGTLVDKVAYGTANCAEGTAVAALTNASGAVRNNGGLTDTDNNSADFTIVANPVPRNSQSSRNPDCLATPTLRQTWGTLKTLYR